MKEENLDFTSSFHIDFKQLWITILITLIGC